MESVFDKNGQLKLDYIAWRSSNLVGDPTDGAEIYISDHGTVTLIPELQPDNQLLMLKRREVGVVVA